MLQIKPLGKVGLYISATEVHTSVLDSMTRSAFKRPLFQRPLFKRLLLSCYLGTSLDDMLHAWLS